MFCLSPSTLIINVFNFLIKIALLTFHLETYEFWSFFQSRNTIWWTFIPDELEWNGKEEGFFVEWLSYFVLFTDRCSYAITGSHPHFILSTAKFCKPLRIGFFLVAISVVRFSLNGRIFLEMVAVWWSQIFVWSQKNRRRSSISYFWSQKNIISDILTKC